MRYLSNLFILLLIAVSCSSDNVLSDEPNTVVEYQYLEHNKWIYKQMNNQYLWREDLPDSLSCNYELVPSDFFKSLLSPNDRFSYLTTNPAYSGSIEYGFAYQRYFFKGQVIYEVLYIKNPDLRKQGMKRGDFIDIGSSNGYRYYSKLEIEENSIHPSGKIFTESADTRGISNESNTVLLDSVYHINNKKIGYICYLEFDKISDLKMPFLKMLYSEVEELIIDLRYNPGGYVKTCQYLCNCIVPSSAYNEIFQKCRYNNILSEEYSKTTGCPYTLSLFQTPSSTGGNTLGTSLIPLNQKRVFFLTSSHTASSSEAAIICLRPYMEVIVIGENTLGKGVGSWTIADPKFKYSLQPITMRYFNANDETTPDEGLVPDVYVSDGYSTTKKDIGDINENLLNVAVNIIFNQSDRIPNYMEENQFFVDQSLRPIGEPSFVEEFKRKGGMYLTVHE